MDALTYTSYAVAGVVSQDQARLQRLIAAAGQNPVPESITAAKQVAVQAEAATLVLAKAISATRQMGSDLLTLADQQSGLGQKVDLYA